MSPPDLNANEYRSLAEHTPDMVIRWDRQLRRLYVNPALLKAIGRSREDVVGTELGSQYQSTVSFANADYLANLGKRVLAVFETGEPAMVELAWIGIHGKRIIDHRLVPERGPDGEVVSVLGIGRDITELRSSEREIRTLLDHSPDVIARFDTAGRYMYVNKTTEKLTGVPLASYIGRHVGDVIGTNAAGEPLAGYAALREHIMTVCIEGRTVETELAFTLGGQSRVFNVRVLPELDETGAVASALLVSRDITERREAEEQLRQAQKMEAIGQLAGGIAHDFNNMLAIISMQAGLGLLPNADPEDTRPSFETILEATKRAANLTRQLMAFSRRQIARRVPLDLHGAVDNIAKLLKRLVGEHVTVETRLATGLPTVLADAGMIDQIVMNLALNARDAMPHGGALEISLAAVDVASSRSDRTGPHVCLKVADTGCGIAADNLAAIFEPFFTTKPPGSGTGLGLAIVFGIVEQHDGWIEVDSEVDRGTTFRVYFPIHAEQLAASEATAAPVEIARGRETVLVVEDEPAVRVATRRALEQYGYRVLEAGTASAALEHWRHERERIELVLTDVVLAGGTSGVRLAQSLTAEAPQLKVIYMSGHISDVVERMTQLDPDLPVLRKPFEPTELARCVRRCLDGAPPRVMAKAAAT